ncbi:MAG: L,D-transpeptidase, partial [Pseudobdellovibrionaceae bacterium]
MRARLMSFLFALLMIGANSFAKESVEGTQLDDLLTPDEIAAELGISQPTDLTPQADPFTAQEISDTYGVNIYAEFPVVIVLSKASQTATVYEHGRMVNRFLISTGRERFETAKSGKQYFTTTPTGWFSPKSYVRDYWSDTWEARMEYAIFFNGGVALHATTPDHYKDLGHKASGGCVRMNKTNALWFWNLSLAN